MHADIPGVKLGQQAHGVPTADIYILTPRTVGLPFRVAVLRKAEQVVPYPLAFGRNVRLLH